MQFIGVEGKVLGKFSQLTLPLDMHKSCTLITWMVFFLLLFSILPVIAYKTMTKIIIGWKIVTKM